MFLMDVPVNYMAVLTAALTYFMIGAVWYAPFMFGHRWKQYQRGETAEHSPQYSCSSCTQSYVGEGLISLILAYVLTLFIQISQALEVKEGVAVALWIWLGFIATTHFSAVLWDRKTIKSFLIHAGFMLIGLIAMALVIMFFEP